ncbi:Enolase 2 [bacterium HR17]|uniref:Enolase n=1 Tax=Candidatus Fervidibacter japonicus TaxID=2035412 RepID=A0A2H5XAX9_9BACT|nr:Enolase 2 [bacterium HR17]
MTIQQVHAREVLDSRGYPTVEAEVVLDNGAVGWAMVPSGASTGTHEATELRDGDLARWDGKGVLVAVHNINEHIAPALRGVPADVKAVDARLRELDGTPNKRRLGANAVLAVSLATARAVAYAHGLPLYRFIAELAGTTDRMALPTPMVNIVSGGLHAGGNLDMQDFLVIPLGATSFRQALDWVGKVYHTVKRLLREQGMTTLVADEGGFGPPLPDHEAVLRLLCEAVERVGLRQGDDVALAVDVAATHFYHDGHYVLRQEGRALSGDELVALLTEWCQRYPVLSVEDGCAEEDWDGWRKLTQRLGQRVQLLGDDLFVTNPERIRKGAAEGIANAVLIKVNQIGTLTETLEAMQAGWDAGYALVVSARSGETEDPFIADLAVGTGAGQIKIGSVARSERTAKYNQLLRIEERGALSYAGKQPFERLCRGA